jgi:putative DNA primase/helicase
MQTQLNEARSLVERGLCVVPVPHGKKEASLKGWPDLRLTLDELTDHFDGLPQNIGVIVGEPSGLLADVDIDWDMALPVAKLFLPTTGAVFGRTSRPRSHYLYKVDREALVKLLDPVREKSDDDSERRDATIIEIRAKQGHLTLFPPSEHSGEVVRWDIDEEPAHITADELTTAVKVVAAIVLLARYWPDGARHEASKALFGALLRAGWGGEDTRRFVEAICLAAHDDETPSRLRNGETTEQKIEGGKAVTGWPTLAEIFDKRIVDRVCEWLNIKSDPRSKAYSQAWDAPVPMPDDLLPVPQFYPQLLPTALRAWIVDVTERMQCPMEFPAIAALVAAASTIGNRIQIRPKREDDWTVVPNIWGAIVAKPGLLKTPALDAALKPLKSRERLSRDDYKIALEDFDFQKMQADAQRDQLRKDISKSVKDGGDGGEYRLRLNEISSETPVEKRYIVNDPTVEKLGELLNQNPRGLLLFRDELVGWLSSLDRQGREQDRTFYLETWAGSGSYTYDRIGRGTIRIENLTLSILGGIQPGPLAKYLRGTISGGYNDDGLMQRFQLAVFPDSVRCWRNVDRQPDGEAAILAHECFAKLDALEPEAIGADTTITLEGTTVSFLRFEQEAQGFFNEWLTELETELRSDSYEHPALEGHMAKYRSLMPSLALIFHLIDKASGISESEGVSLDAARCAAAWCKLLEEHARRIYGLALNAEARLAKTILERIRRGELEPEFTARDIYRRQWTGLSTASDVSEPLRILEDYGWLRRFSIGGGESGGRPSTCYLAHPSLIKDGQ